MKTRQQGFSLIELLITMLILAILATLAFPSYQYFVRKTRLNNVRSELLHNAKNLERFYTQRSTFAGYDKTQLKQHEFFTISLTSNSASAYSLQAAPNANNSGETCTVHLNSNGMFWATSSQQGENCPGYENATQQ